MVVSRRAQKMAAVSATPLLFDYFKRYNLLEIKTEQTPLTLGDLLKLQAYTWLYMQKQAIYAIAEVTATAVVHHLTPEVIAALPALRYKPVSSGIFRCDSSFESYIISIEDLPDELAPEELQVFSNSARRQKIFLSCYGKTRKEPIIDALVDLYESEVIKLMTPLNVRPESMPKFIKALGKEKVIAALIKDKELPAQRKKQLLAALSKKQLLAALSKKELLAALTEDDMISALGGKEYLLKSFLASYKPEQLQKLLAQPHRNGASRRQSAKSKTI